MSYDDIVIFENQLNDDIPSEITSEITSETNNSIFQRNVFNLPEDLFIPTESSTSYDLIEIYKNNKTAEFIDIIFKNNILPSKLLMLENLTELVIRKCPLDEISLLPVNLEKATFNKCGLKIVSCKNFPANLKYVNFSDNRLELFIDIIPSITHLYLDDNRLTYINDLPEGIQVISLKNNMIKKINFLRHNLKELYLNNNQIKDIDDLFDSIEILDVSKNNISIIKMLPNRLKILIAYNCKITNFLCKFPPFLEKLDLYNNNLEFIPDFTDEIKWVDLSSNELRVLPKNISKLNYLDISSNSNLIYDPTNIDWNIFMENKVLNKEFIMDEQYTNNRENDDRDYDNDYIINSSSDSIINISDLNNSSIESSSESDFDDNLLDINKFKRNNRIKKSLHRNNNLNINNNDNLDELFGNEFNIYDTNKNNNIEKDNNTYDNTDDKLMSIIRNIRNNSESNNSESNNSESNNFKQKRIVKALKTFSI